MPEHTLSYPHTTHLSQTNASTTLYMHHTQTRNTPTEEHCTCVQHTQKPLPTVTHTHHKHTQERTTFYSLLFFLSHMITNKEYKYSAFLNWNIADFQNYVSFGYREGIVIQYVCRLYILSTKDSVLFVLDLYDLQTPNYVWLAREHSFTSANVEI